MKHTSIIFWGMILTLGLMMMVSPLAMAQQEDQQPVLQPETGSLTGRIFSLNPETLTVALKYLSEADPEQELTTTLFFTDATTITGTAGPATFSDLKPGDTLEVTFTKEGGWKKMVDTAVVQPTTP